MAEAIERDRLQELIAAGAQLVDALPAREYEEEHIPGARSIPLSRLNRDSVATLDSSRPIVVYCWDIA